MMKSITRPKAIAQTETEAMYTTNVFFPRVFAKIVKEATFVTGPANKKTKAAPGEIPFIIRETAIGMDAVEHTYIGIPITNIISILTMGIDTDDSKSCGINVEINVAINKPTTKFIDISSKNDPKP